MVFPLPDKGTAKRRVILDEELGDLVETVVHLAQHDIRQRLHQLANVRQRVEGGLAEIAVPLEPTDYCLE